MTLRTWLLGAPQTLVSPAERARSAVGAALGILVTGSVSALVIGTGPALPALIAPMGASAVLLFAVPASPLAQPRSLLGGNLVAALVGVAVALSVPDPVLASAFAIGIAVALMTTFGCLHPPSGAIALTAVLGGETIRDLGFAFVLWPVGLNSLLILAVAFGYNRIVGRPYPHRPSLAAAPRVRDPLPEARVGFRSADLDAVLEEYDRILDIDRGDLEAILREAEMRAWGRRFEAITCASIMTHDVVSIAPGARLREAFGRLRAHHVKALPVTEADGRVVGIVTQTDLLDKAAWGKRGPRLGFMRALRAATAGRGPLTAGSVAEIMTTPVRTASPDASLGNLVRLMSKARLHHLPVVDGEGRLVGIVSQSDLTVALLAAGADRPTQA